MRVQGSVGYVYIIKSSDGYCKVGKALSPEGRLRTLQSGSAHRLHLYHKIETDSYDKCELFFHHILRHYRMQGEWFDLPEYLVEKIRGIASLNLSDMTRDREEAMCGWLPPDKNPRAVSEQKKRQEAEERLKREHQARVEAQRREAQARARDPRYDEKKARAEKKAREDEQIRQHIETLLRNQHPHS